MWLSQRTSSAEHELGSYVGDGVTELERVALDVVVGERERVGVAVRLAVPVGVFVLLVVDVRVGVGDIGAGSSARLADDMRDGIDPE